MRDPARSASSSRFPSSAAATKRCFPPLPAGYPRLVPDRASASETVLAGRYRLVRPIARGGMAEVWEGHDVVLDRPVAVKLLHAHLASDETFLERFRRRPSPPRDSLIATSSPPS